VGCADNRSRSLKRHLPRICEPRERQERERRHPSADDSSELRHAYQLGEWIGLHLFHRSSPMNLDGPFREAEIEGDLLVDQTRL
jgi:hypothetical protein